MENNVPLLAPAVAKAMRHESTVVRKEAARAAHCLLGDAPTAMARCATPTNGGKMETEVCQFLWGGGAYSPENRRIIRCFVVISNYSKWQPGQQKGAKRNFPRTLAWCAASERWKHRTFKRIPSLCQYHRWSHSSGLVVAAPNRTTHDVQAEPFYFYCNGSA